MVKIEQALFGYSNGHRLLGSSIKLSTSSLRLMEILSDLSGNSTSENFDGYYTGCWLPDDNCYAISKTWYATEMPRPGCAWTHTLFLDSQIFSTTIKIPIDSLFKRPDINNNDFLSYYRAPINIDLKDGNNYSNLSDTLWLLQIIISKKENIAISYDNALDFNLLFTFLFQLMGVEFFKNFTFCTGSQTNRMIKDKPLNLQVMPEKISKVALRSLSTVVPFEINTDNLYPFYITNFDDLLKVKDFAVQIDENCYSFESFQSIQELYYALYKVDRVDLQRVIFINKNAFPSDQAIKMFTSELNVFIKDSLANINDSSFVLDLLFSISTTKEYENFINSLNVINFSKYIFELSNKDRSNILRLISKLLVSKLNIFGQKFLKELAFAINSDDLVQLLSEKQTYCTALLQCNWKLAKNKTLWKMPLGIQFELIKNIAVAFNQSTYEDKASFSELLFLIFENSTEEVFDEVYTAFGDFSITTYFFWIDNNNNNFNKNNWIHICKNSPSQSLSLLQSVSHSNFEIFYSLLEVIDPWDKSIHTVKTRTWEKLYDDYCKGKNNNQLNDMFAKFMLQVMINTNVKLSNAFAYFVFMRVHKILESPDFDDVFWHKIDSYLPEVKWYNSWDKCKRLRKYTKKIGYNNIFQ